MWGGCLCWWWEDQFRVNIDKEFRSEVVVSKVRLALSIFHSTFFLQKEFLSSKENQEEENKGSREDLANKQR